MFDSSSSFERCGMGPSLKSKVESDLKSKQTSAKHFSKGINEEDLDFYQLNGHWLFGSSDELWK